LRTPPALRGHAPRDSSAAFRLHGAADFDPALASRHHGTPPFMTDTDTSGAPAGGNGEISPDAAPGVRVLAQFVRDLSFENPRAPESLRAASQPQIELSVEMNARARPDGLFEVDLKLGATAHSDGEPNFQIELLYGGLFQITGVPEEELEPVLLIECPRFLFPFARRVIADVSADGGFPPFLIDPIDFAAVYAARRAQLENQPVGLA
jgi:preprotein translocase subunit SecB